MIIFKDAITGDELFSDTYKMKLSENGILYEVEGKMVCRTEDIDGSLIGANASADCVDEACEASTVSGVDIVLNHHLQQTSHDKDSYKTHIKEYMKRLRAHLEKTNPERVKPFMAGAQEEVKKIMGNVKNLQFFTGESMNPDGMVCLLDYREDGITPFMLFFKDGLESEKC